MKEVDSKLKLVQTYKQMENVEVVNFTEEIIFGDKKEINKYKKRNCNIFIIGDNNENIGFLFDKLKYGFDLFYSDNIKDAVKKINSIPLPDIIIMDYFIDKEDDFIFLKKLDEDNILSSIPLMFFGSNVSYDDKVNGLQLGAVDFIIIPESIDELVFKIESIINIKRNLENKIRRNIEKKVFNVFKNELKKY